MKMIEHYTILTPFLGGWGADQHTSTNQKKREFVNSTFRFILILIFAVAKRCKDATVFSKTISMCWIVQLRDENWKRDDENVLKSEKATFKHQNKQMKAIKNNQWSLDWKKQSILILKS